MSAAPPTHAFVPHLWKQGACRECTMSQAEHSGGSVAAPVPAARSPAKPAVTAAANPASPPLSRPVQPAAATSPAVSPAPAAAAAAPVGRVAAMAKRAEMIQPAAAGAVAPAMSGPPGVALKTKPAAAASTAAAAPSVAKPPPPSLPSAVGTAMTVAAAATAFRRPLVAKLPPPLPSVIAAGSNNAAVTAASAQSVAATPAASTPVNVSSVKHSPPPPLPVAVLPLPDRPVPPLPSTSPPPAAMTVDAAVRATSPIPERPVPPLPASSAAAAAAAPSAAAARASPTSPTSSASSGGVPSPTNASSANTLPGMPPPPTRKPPAPPNRAPPKAPTTPTAAAASAASPVSVVAVPAATAAPAFAVEPPSPASAGPPTTRLVRAASVGSGPPRLPPPLSSVMPASAAPSAAPAATASTPVPPSPSSAATATAAPVPARVPPPLHAVVAAGAVGPPPLPVSAASSSAVPPPLPVPAAAAASVVPPPVFASSATATTTPQQRFPPPPPQSQSQSQSLLSSIAEAPSSSSGATVPPPPPPPRGPPPLNLPASAATAVSAGPPPLPASAVAVKASAPPSLPYNSGTAATRLVDYFCVFGRGPLCLDALDTAADFPPAAKSYPDAQAASAAAWAALRFLPVLLPSQRYPASDHRDSALSGNTASFAFPSYISLQLCAQREVDDPYSPSWVARRPKMHRFTLTKLDGTKQFCSSLTFYERVGGAQIEGLLAEIEAALRGRIVKPSGCGPQAKDIDIEAFMIELRNGACGRSVPVSSASAAVPPPPPPTASVSNGRPPPPPPSLPRSLPPSCALFVPKSLTVVSSWPFFSLWEEMLKALFRTSHVGLSQASIRKFATVTHKRGGDATTAAGSIELHPDQYSVLSLPLPLERLLVNFLCEIPVPPPGILQVRFHLPPGSWLSSSSGSGGGEGSDGGSDGPALLISRPPINQLPLCDINWHLLFRAVAPEAFVAIFTAIAVEQKVLLVSRSANLITAVCDAVAVLLFPLAWQGVFMPLLPEPMLEFLFAPVPFLAGIDSECFARHFDSTTGDIELPEELVLVELDAMPSARIRIPADSVGDSIPQLPEKVYSKLLAQIKEHAGIHNPTHPFVRISDQAFPFGQEQDRVELSPAAVAAMAKRRDEAATAMAGDVDVTSSHVNGTHGIVEGADRTPPPLPPSQPQPQPQPLVPAAYQALSTAFEPVQTYIPIPQAAHSQPQSTMQRRGSYPPPSRGAAGSISGNAILSPSSVASLDSTSPPVAAPSLDALSGTSAALDRGVELNVEQVREAFLRLWCKLLKSYNKFMPWGVHASPAAASASTPSSNGGGAHNGGSASPPVSPTLSPAASPGASSGGGASDVWFNTAGFLAHAPRDARPFLTQLCRSQLFAKFVDDRILVRADIEAWQASPAHPSFEAQQTKAAGGSRKRAGAHAPPAPLRPSSPSGFSTTSNFSAYSAATTPSALGGLSSPSHSQRSRGTGIGGHADDSDSDHDGANNHHQQQQNHNEDDEAEESATGEPSQSQHHHSKTRSVSSMGFASRSGFTSGLHSRQSSTLDAAAGAGDAADCTPSTVCPPSFLSAQLDARDPTQMPILAQVQFFDECMLAQKNRRISKGVRGVLHSKSDFFPTPFLHDTSHSVARIEDTLRPSLEGLPPTPLEYGFPLLRSTPVALPAKAAPMGLQASTAVYPVFPTLDPALFGQPRPIPMLSTEKEKLAAAAAKAAAAEAEAEDEIAPELRYHFSLPPPLPPSVSNGSKTDDSNRAVRFAVDDSPPSSPRLSQPAPGSSHPAYSRATPASLRTTQRGSFIAFRARAPSGMQSHIAELANLLSFESFSGAARPGPPPVPTGFANAAAVSSPASASSSSSAASSAPVAIGNKTLHKLMEKERLKQEKARKKAAQAAQRKDEAAAAQAQQHQQDKKKHVTWTPPVYSSSQSVQSAAAAASKVTTPSNSGNAEVTNPSALVRSGTVIGRGRAGSSIFSFNDSGRIEAVNPNGQSSASGKSVSFASGPASAAGTSAAVHAHASTPKSQPSSSKGALVKPKFGTMQSSQSQQTQPPPPPPPQQSQPPMQQQMQGHEISRPIMLPVEAMPSVMQAQAAAAQQKGQGQGQPPQTPPPLPAATAGAVISPVLPPPLPVGVSPSAARMTNGPPPVPGTAAASAVSPAAAVSPPRLPPPLNASVSPTSVLPPPLPSSSSAAASVSVSDSTATRPPPPPRRMSTIAPPPLPPSASANAATVQPRKPPPPLR